MNNPSDLTGKQLRILMIAPQPFFQARGTPFSVLHRIRVLVEAGHKVDLVTYPFGEDIHLPGLHIIRSGRLPFIYTIKTGPSINKLLLDFPLYFKAVQVLREGEYDVLHSHEEAAFFSPRLARKYKLRHIYDMHSSLPQQLQNFRSFNLKLFSNIFERLERHVLRTCDGVITICPELAEIALKECQSTPHAMIENTADDAKIFGKGKNDPRMTYGLEDKQIILYTGTFESYQGLDILLGAYARIRANKSDIHLLMVGGRPDQIASYEQLACSLGVNNDITFAGTVHPSKIPAFLKAANVIVSPRSHGTNTPLKIYGYMRSGCPLVATDLLTHTQVLDDSIAHLVPPTEEGLASGIEHILDNPDAGKCLADAAAIRAEELFSDELYYGKVTKFYEQVMHRTLQCSSGCIANAE